MSASASTSTESALIAVRLMAIRYAAQDTHVFEFAPVAGGVLPAAAPGAHIDLHLPGGAAGGRVRSYSLLLSADLAVDAAQSYYRVGVKRDAHSSGGSRYLHEQMRVGMTLEISPPRNHFPLHEGDAPSVFIAGGIGITPIWSMLQRQAARGFAWALHYASRTREEAAFAAELQALPAVHLHIDAEQQGQVLDIAAIVAAAPAGAHFYCCGPKPMLAAFEAATADVPAQRVHLEYFSAKQEAASAGGYTVVLARSGRELAVPEGRSILDVLREAGVEVGYSCEQGVCGACETKVIAGTPDHRDSILTTSEREASRSMMICCSGSHSARLELDL